VDEQIRERTAIANGIRLHYLLVGEGPLVVLLHGWPQTSHMWRGLASSLGERRTVLAPDLRGYGNSDKPISGYDKRTMAADVHALVETLGFDRCALVGHDRGARVAHRYCLDHPEVVTQVVFMDIIPTRALFSRADVKVARGFWHWLFHTQPDIPELLIGSNIRGYLLYFFERWTHNRAAFDAATLEHYLRAYEAPGALRGFLDDYRGTFQGDLEDDDASAAAGLRVRVPALAMWGEHGLVSRVPVLEVWRDYADDVRGDPLPDCGHFLVEEQPELVHGRVHGFLDEEGA
jgi:haloacetate dehalogenase